MRIISTLAATFLAFAPATAARAQCGGNFGTFVDALKAEAVSTGHGRASVERFFAGVQHSPSVIRADRAQGIFNMPFTDFARRVISGYRMTKGRQNADHYAATFRAAEQRYGVPAGVLLAFWALETDFGAVQGDFNTLNALVTLAHDCRRPDLFRPQIFSALELYQQGDFDPATTTGAWAGEIGMVQMLPDDILRLGIDGDGDGHVRLKTSPADALMTGAHLLSSFGWRPGEPWLQEIILPRNIDLSQTGLRHEMPVSAWKRLGVRARSGRLGQGRLSASVLLPQGHMGPAFLAYPNYRVYFEWNQSFVYVTTAAYFATRLSGAPVFDARTPEPGLNDQQMRALQSKLQARGYDVGKIDGILGSRTRAAVQAEQLRLGLPADAWPTQALLDRL